ncbi:hypothetical protein L0636_01135 [Halomonas janggokensis]|uniref:Uncharacterized protein n=1 Tax=Vreelandella janggokensis TaxID=370767 RepID=A0ABT4IS53_9GAMM|nr:hypothetical protein [Halomonas janggokensis]MCZ0926492.1 hypothetical protein [Halomonas janggokensis]MCZ0929030.1 hypothetical protein [Halomonas janggokensis]
MGEITVIPKQRPAPPDPHEKYFAPRKVARTFLIQQYEDGSFDVIEGDRRVDRLGWDEMLGHVAQLTHRQLGTPLYRMRTPEEELEYEAFIRGYVKRTES